MTVLTNKMYEIFDQEEFSFKKLVFQGDGNLAQF